MSTSTWKYNREKHQVEGYLLPTEENMKKEVPQKQIPVSGTVDWKDGQELKENIDFTIGVHSLNNDISGIRDVAIQIKQEQPHRDGFIHEEGVTKTPYPIYPHEIRDESASLGRFKNQSQEQPQQEAIEKMIENNWDDYCEKAADNCNAIESDAVEFAEWMVINYWRYLKSSAKWTNRDDDLLTTKELYKLFKNKTG